MKTRYSALISLGVTLLVAGCGGGSSGGNTGVSVPTEPVKITSSNAQTVAKGVVTSAQSVTEATSVVSMVTGIVAQPSAHLHSVKEIALTMFAKVRGMQLAPATGAVGVIAGLPATETCAGGGSQTFNVTDANNNGTFDAGDTRIVSFSACNDGFSTRNGSMSFAVTTLSQEATTMAAFTATFSGFSERDNTTGQTQSVNGDITFSITESSTSLTGTMSGNSLSVSDSVEGAFQLTDFMISLTESSTGYSYSYNMEIASTVAGGSITIATAPPFTGTTGNKPTAGEMVVTGANDSTLTITALSDGIHVDLTVDDDGAGPNAPQVSHVTWADLY